MITKLGTNLGEIFCRKGYIQYEDIDYIRFGIEVLCSEIFEFLFIVIYGMITKSIIQTLLFVCIFRILRKYFEGYHAKTAIRCVLLTISVYLIVIHGYSYITMNWIYLILGTIICVQIYLSYKTKNYYGIIVSGIIIFLSIGLSILGYKEILQICTITECVVTSSAIVV